MNRISTPIVRPEIRHNFLEKLAFPLLMLIVVGFAWRPLTGGDDFWAHASIGRWILENGRIPRETLFLWSEKIPWIAHAWGTGIIFALLMRIGGENVGPYLAQIFNALLCLFPFALIWRFYRQNNRFSSWMAPVFVLGIWVSAARFHPRPELYTAVFLTFLLLFLTSWPRQKSVPKASIAGILLMFVVWPNLHGAVAIGLVLLWVAALAELIQSRGDNRLLLLAAVCTLLIFVCNPRGFDYYRVIMPIASKTFERIDEWKPFWKWPTLATELWVGELILWAFGFLLWTRNPQRRWMQLGWMLLMLAAFLQARRQLWLTALTSLIVIVSNTRFDSNDLFYSWRKLTKGDTSEAIPSPMRLIARLGILLILVCALAQSIPRDFYPIRATNRKLPVKMAAFVRDQAPQGRLFNDYEFSAYLQWALHGKRGLYIDLNNAYPDSLMDEYFAVQAFSKNPQKMKQFDIKRAQILSRRKIDVVALRPFTKKEGLSIVGNYLDKNPGWKRIYRQSDGTVWTRRAKVAIVQ
ncbi:hypothetical protein B1R32_10260 [Abditibacterium utsteinense]|uniref:Glycosyltransferase RgtA/B/C/D-like domain-containing protein n=1 Tax=Abditibacterium utsteinense TaxID=1960156 RepID=A0A2S8SW80_9BACT|nr:hypothetical protein [Abditibacterium utsteinense]PQV65053.1 hypothetical protein B1R32_10260 [Abditibacterium utsteinense]